MSKDVKKRYRIKGINDDANVCERCGKTHLKKVVWAVELDDDGNEVGPILPYGTTCIKKLATNKINVKTLYEMQKMMDHFLYHLPRKKAIDRFKSNQKDTEYKLQTLLAIEACNDLKDLPSEEELPEDLTPIIKRIKNEKKNAALLNEINDLKKLISLQ